MGYEKKKMIKNRHHPSEIRKMMPIFTFVVNRDLCTFNFSGTQASGAYINPFVGAILKNALHTLDIGLPHFVGSSMRMAHLDSKMSPFSTNRTFSHFFPPCSLISTQQEYITKELFKKQAKLFVILCKMIIIVRNEVVRIAIDHFFEGGMNICKGKVRLIQN